MTIIKAVGRLTEFFSAAIKQVTPEPRDSC